MIILIDVGFIREGLQGTVKQQEKPSTRSSAVTYFSPISVMSTQRSRSNSPHTFVSNYGNQETWNAIGSGTITTDEDDEDDDDDHDTDVHHDSCDDSFRQEGVNQVPCLARKSFAREMDECSSLSSNTRDNDLDILWSSDDENVVVAGADNPPKATERTSTADDPLQEQGKVSGRAFHARKRPPLHSATESSATVSEKSSGFLNRRKQRLMERTSIQKNHQDDQVAVAVAGCKEVPNFAVSTTSVAVTAVGSTPLSPSVTSLYPASYPSSAIAASTSTDGKQRAGTSMAELEDDLKKQAARPVSGTIMERRTPTAARLKSGESSRTVNSSASSSMQARWASRHKKNNNNFMLPRYAPASMDRSTRKTAMSLDEEGPQMIDKAASPLQATAQDRNAFYVSPSAIPLAVSRADDRAAAKAANVNQDTCKSHDSKMAKKKAPPSTTSDIKTAMQDRAASRAYEPRAINSGDDRAAAKATGTDDGTKKKPPPETSVPSDLDTPMQARNASRTFTVATHLAVSRADGRVAAKGAVVNEDSPKLLGKKPPPGTACVPSDLQAVLQIRNASRIPSAPIPLAVSRADDKTAAKAAGRNIEDLKLTGKKFQCDTTFPSSDLGAAMQARKALRSATGAIPLAVSRADDRAATKTAGNNPEGFQMIRKKSTSETSYPHPDLRASMKSHQTSHESLAQVAVAFGRPYDKAAAKANGDGGTPHPVSSFTSSLQVAMQARRAPGASSAPAPLAVSRADDRAASKVATMDDSSDDEQGPKLAIASMHKVPFSNKSLLDSDSGENSRRSSSRRSLDSTANKTNEGATASATGNKSPPIGLQAAMQSRTSSRTPRVPGASTMSRMLNRARAKMTGDEKSSEEDKSLKLDASRQRNPPSSLEEAIQARTSSRASTVPMPTTVSRMLDRAAAKMADNEDSSDKEKELKFIKNQGKSTPSDLQTTMQARSVSRASTVPMPISVSRLLDVAAAKMADDDDDESSFQEGPSLAGATIGRKWSQKPAPSSAAMAMQTRGSSGIEKPRSISYGMDRAAAKMIDDVDGDESSLDEGPSLADTALNRKKSQKPSPSSAGMAMGRRCSSGVEMPRSLPRDMDHAITKMANDDESSEEEGPRLAGSIGEPAYASNRSRASAKSSVCHTVSVDGAEEDLHLVVPDKTPGAIVSSEDSALQEKLAEFAEEDEEEGPSLASPAENSDLRPGAFGASSSAGCFKEDYDYDYDHGGIESVQDDDLFCMSGADKVYDVEAQQEDIVEAQTGLVVSAGAYAVQGIDARCEEDDLFRESIDPTNTAAIEEELGSVRRENVADAIAAVTVVPTSGAAPLEAELYEEAHVEADLYEEVDLESDPKFIRKLRLMQGVILCCSLAGLGFVVLSVIMGFGSNSSEVTALPEITGWEPVGGAIFGPQFERTQVFFGSVVAMTSSGKRIAVTGPGADSGNTANVGAVYIWEESVMDGWSEIEPNQVNKTWKLSESIEGPGPSTTASSSLAMTLDGGRVAVGYPFYKGGLVQVFDEENGWQEELVTINEGNTTGDEILFGYAIDLSQDGAFLAVGSPLDDTSGSVRIMGRAGDGSWQQIGEVIRGSQPGELFGWSISLVQAAKLRVAIGSPSHNTDTGLLRVYDFIGSDWIQVGETLAGTDTLNRFGEACTLSSDGKVLAVGVHGSAFEPGAVHIYRENDGKWEMDPQGIKGSEPGGAFGSALSMTPDGSTLVIGGSRNNEFGNGSGYIQVWSFNGADWVQQGSNIGGSEETAYGSSVSISADGQRVVGGAPQADYDRSVAETGHFRVFDRNEPA